MKHVYRGQFEYIKKKKTERLIICLIWAALIIGILVAGFLITKSRESIFTVAAILTVLPAAKFVVSFCMLLPYQSQTKEKYDMVCKAAKEAIVCTDMLISTEKKVLPTDFIVIRDGNVCGYSAHPKFDARFAQEYLTAMYKRNGVKPNIKMFTDEKKFLQRVRELAAMEIDEKQAERDNRTKELLLTLIL